MLEILKDDTVVAEIAPGGRFSYKDPERRGYIHVNNVTLETVIPGHTIREKVWPEPQESEPSPEERKAQLIAYAAARRYEKEIGGMTWNDWPVHTDRESQGKIIAERLAVEAGEREDPDGWKFADGVFRMVSNTDFVSLSNAVRDHVRAAFAVEAAVLMQIEAGIITSEAEIDADFE